MNIVPPPTRISIEIVLIEENKARKITAYNSPATIPLPEVGDEIGFPDNALGTIGANTTVFKVIKRRFAVPINQDFTSLVFIFVSPVAS